MKGLPATCRPAIGGRLALVPERDSRRAGQSFHRLDEGQVLHLLQELEDVPPLAAAEAVVDLLRRAHGQRWRLLRVEWTQADHRVPSGLSQLKVLGDDLDDVGSLSNRIHVFLADQS